MRKPCPALCTAPRLLALAEFSIIRTMPTTPPLPIMATSVKTHLPTGRVRTQCLSWGSMQTPLRCPARRSPNRGAARQAPNLAAGVHKFLVATRQEGDFVCVCGARKHTPRGSTGGARTQRGAAQQSAITSTLASEKYSNTSIHGLIQTFMPETPRQ